MEQHTKPIGGFDPAQPEPMSGDELAIHLGIEAARAEDREVTDAVARAIAAQLHGGQSSALYSFTSTGSLEHERLDAELSELYRDPNPRIREWACMLGTYALHREHNGAVDGWHEMWPRSTTAASTGTGRRSTDTPGAPGAHERSERDHARPDRHHLPGRRRARRRDRRAGPRG